MGWDDDLFALFDDLEGQAEAAYDAERAPEIADRSRTEYAGVTLASRLMASVDGPIALEVQGLGRLAGRLERVATGWCLVAARGQGWIVVTDAIRAVEEASDRSVPEVAWSPVARLGLGSALRRLAEAGRPCVLHDRDGRQLELTPVRVGHDFVETTVGEGRRVLVPFAAVAAVQDRE